MKRRQLTVVEHRIVRTLRKHLKQCRTLNNSPLSWKSGWENGLQAAIEMVRNGYAGATAAEHRRRRESVQRWMAKMRRTDERP